MLKHALGPQHGPTTSPPPETMIRSNMAATLLNEMARDGRTKIGIIEDALERAVAEANDAVI